MKRIHLTLVLVTMFCMAAFAGAAGASPAGMMEINAGYAKSSNDVTVNNESMGGGIAFGAGYWRSASPSIMWGGEISYDNLGSVDYNNGTSTTTFSSHTLRFCPAMRMNFGASTGPNFFAQGGMGLYSVGSKVEDPTSTPTSLSSSTSKFGFNLGAGVGFPVGPKTKMNVMGQWHSVATEGETLHYLAFRAGMCFNL